MKNIAAILLASIAITGCKGLMGPAVEVIECDGSQTDCINNWFDEKFTEMLDFSPILQTSLGIKTDYDKLDDFSEEGIREQIAWAKQARAEMKANFDYEGLSDEAKQSYDMFVYLTTSIEKRGDYLDQEYILHQMHIF